MSMIQKMGSKPPRTILSGVGPLEVIQPRVDDRRIDENCMRFHFTSTILPPYSRKTTAVEELVPWMYLISTSDFTEALACFGHDGSGLSATTVTRMTQLGQGPATFDNSSLERSKADFDRVVHWRRRQPGCRFFTYRLAFGEWHEKRFFRCLSLAMFLGQ
jgi:hypothetical protein